MDEKTPVSTTDGHDEREGDALAKGAYAVGKRIGDLGRAFGEFKREFEEALHEDDDEDEAAEDAADKVAEPVAELAAGEEDADYEIDDDA